MLLFIYHKEIFLNQIYVLSKEKINYKKRKLKLFKNKKRKSIQFKKQSLFNIFQMKNILQLINLSQFQEFRSLNFLLYHQLLFILLHYNPLDFKIQLKKISQLYKNLLGSSHPIVVNKITFIKPSFVLTSAIPNNYYYQISFIFNFD